MTNAARLRKRTVLQWCPTLRLIWPRENACSAGYVVNPSGAVLMRMVDQSFSSSNQLLNWLRQLHGLRLAM
jgi:hypothetical protein